MIGSSGQFTPNRERSQPKMVPDLAIKAIGDAVATNAFMLGYARQKGLIPLSEAALLRAIELNAVAVARIKCAFTIGRPAAVEAQAPKSIERVQATAAEDFATLIERRKAELTIYPNAEDEYEVARLYADEAFARKLRARFENGLSLPLHIAPPLISRHDPVTGELMNGTYGPCIFSFVRILHRAEFLRGSRANPFGHSVERKTERDHAAERKRPQSFADCARVCASHLADDRDPAGRAAISGQGFGGSGRSRARGSVCVSKSQKRPCRSGGSRKRRVWPTVTCNSHRQHHSGRATKLGVEG